MLKTISRLGEYGLSLAVTMGGIAMADGPTPDCFPCYPSPDTDCVIMYGAGWYFCGYADGYAWCCAVGE